jgi:hypothetical protein
MRHPLIYVSVAALEERLLQHFLGEDCGGIGEQCRKNPDCTFEITNQVARWPVRLSTSVRDNPMSSTATPR